MATWNSTEMTNLLAASPTLTSVAQWGGRLRVVGGAFEMDASVAAADVIRLARLPVNARIWKMEFGCDNLGAALTADVGLYQTNGTVLDANEFATALILDSMVYSPSDVIGTETAEIVYQPDVTDIDANGKALWARAGVAADPGGDYDVCLTVVTETTAVAGTIAWTIYYTVD